MKIFISQLNHFSLKLRVFYQSTHKFDFKLLLWVFYHNVLTLYSVDNIQKICGLKSADYFSFQTKLNRNPMNEQVIALFRLKLEPKLLKYK